MALYAQHYSSMQCFFAKVENAIIVTTMMLISIIVTIFVLCKMWVREGGDAIMVGGKSEMASMQKLSRNVADLNLSVCQPRLPFVSSLLTFDTINK